MTGAGLWLSLKFIWAAPLAAFLLALVMGPWRSLHGWIAAACAALIGLVIGCVILRLSFTFMPANVVTAVAAYTCYCLLAAMIWRMPYRFILRLAAVPALLPIGFTYFISTVGLLGFLFFVGDFIEPPRSTTNMAPGLACQRRFWGSAISDSGYTMKLYRSWPLVPWLEREVASISVNESNDRAEPHSADCSDLMAVYGKVQQR